MSDQLDFSGKNALVMGASRGIGLAVAHKLSSLGARVFLAARSTEVVNAEAKKIIESGGEAHSMTTDVSDYQSVKAAVDFCIHTAGSIDFLVNNAGVIEPLSPLIESNPSEWADAVDINFKGVYFGMRAAVPHMIGSGGGVVVNMSSGAANSALFGWSHYCSTKAAAKKLTEVAHTELHDKNVRVVGLSPGTVATDMMARIKESKINAVSDLDWASHISPDRAAEAVAFLCGPGGEAFAGKDFSMKADQAQLSSS